MTDIKYQKLFSYLKSNIKTIFISKRSPLLLETFKPCPVGH